MRLPQEVEPLGGFLGETDDAVGQHIRTTSVLKSKKFFQPRGK
jgi:hypothetical protein